MLIDVRSPCEYFHAHIPNAINIPLFSDEERALVGTCYKQKGKEAAVHLGLKLIGPKLESFVQSFPKKCRLYCARGGMRSQSVDFILKLAGHDVETLSGGYKQFRQSVLAILQTSLDLHVVGGLTGSGKTKYLRELNAQVLDLEYLANHRGSSFGSLGAQPSCEHFENLIAMKLQEFDLSKPIWIEDESRLIGKCKIPDFLYWQMRDAPLYLLDTAKEERVQNLLRDYSMKDPKELVAAAERLRKHLGGARTQEIVFLIQQGQLALAIESVLDYYDQRYLYGLSQRKKEKLRQVNRKTLS